MKAVSFAAIIHQCDSSNLMRDWTQVITISFIEIINTPQERWFEGILVWQIVVILFCTCYFCTTAFAPIENLLKIPLYGFTSKNYFIWCRVHLNLRRKRSSKCACSNNEVYSVHINIWKIKNKLTTMARLLCGRQLHRLWSLSVKLLVWKFGMRAGEKLICLLMKK